MTFEALEFAEKYVQVALKRLYLVFINGNLVS